MNLPMPLATREIVTLLFYKDDFDVKRPKKVDMSLTKKPKQTKPNHYKISVIWKEFY